MIPDLGTLSNLVNVTDQWEQADQSHSQLLESLLAIMTETMPEVSAIRLYHVRGQSLLLRGATDETVPDDAVPQPTEPESVFRQALQAVDPIQTSDGWLYAPQRGERRLGLFAFYVDTSQRATEHASDVIHLIGDQLNAALERRNVERTLQWHSQVAAKLAECMTFSEVADALTGDFLKKGQFIAINLLQRDDAGALSGVKTIVFANRHKGNTPEVTIDLTMETLGSNYAIPVQEGKPHVIEDVQNATPDALNEKLKVKTKDRPVVASAVFPMRSRGRVIGLLTLNDTHAPLNLSAREVDLIQGITDQVTSVVMLYNLSEETETTRDISEQQAQIFNQLVAGQRYRDMAQVVARYMLREGDRLLSIGELSYDTSSKITGWRVVAVANAQRVFDWDEDNTLKWDDLSERLQNAIYDNETTVLNDLSRATAEELGDGLLAWIQQHDVRSYLGIPIGAGEQPLAVMVVTSRRTNGFRHAEVNALQNIADLMGALIETGRLSERTEQAREAVDDLVLANRLITTATSYVYMAQAVVYTLARTLRGAAITLFNEALQAGEMPETHHIIGYSTDVDVRELDPPREVGKLDEPSMRRLQAGTPVVMQDERVARLIPDILKQELPFPMPQWMALFGLRSGNRLLGTLVLYNDTVHTLTEDAISAYTTLADQIGVAIRSNQLLAESQSIQAVAAQLVEANQAIAAANDYTELARVIYGLLPEQQLLGVGLLLVDHPATVDDLPNYTTFEVFAAQDGVETPGIVDRLVDETGGDILSRTMKRLQSGDIIQVDDLREERPPLASNALTFFQERDIHSFVGLGMRSGQRLMGIMLLAKTPGSRLNPSQLDNLRSISDQAGVTIDNRLLLEQTAEALQVTRTLFEATSAVYQAETPEDMLRTVYDFLDDTAIDAHLALTTTTGAEFPMPDNVENLRIAAEINGDTLETPDRVVSFEDYIEADHLRTGQRIVHTNIEADSTLSEDDRETLRQRGFGGVLLHPLLTTSGQLVGLLRITSPNPLNLPDNRMLTLQTLSEQITVALENLQLLATTESSLAEVRSLYDVNRELLRAQDAVDVMRVLARYVASDAAFILMACVVYEEGTNTPIDYRLEYRYEAGVDKRLDQSACERMGETQLEDFLAFWEQRPNLLAFEPDARQHEFASVLAPEDRVVSSIGIPVYDYNGERLHRFVLVAYEQRRTFDAAERRLYNVIRDQVEIVLQNQGLLRDMQAAAERLGEQVRVLETINHISTTLMGTMDETLLFDTAGSALVDALDIDHMGVHLMDQQDITVSLASEYPDRGLTGTRLDADDALVRRLRAESEPIVINDVLNSDAISGALRDLTNRLGSRALLMLPMRDVQGEFLGVVQLDVTHESGRITDDILNIAQTITAQLVVTLRNIRLLRDTQRQARQTELIAEYSRSIQATLDVSALLETSIKNVREVVDTDYVTIVLYNHRHDSLDVVAWQEGDGDVVVNPQDAVMLEKDTTSAERAWQIRGQIRYADFQQREDGLQFSMSEDMRSAVSTPLFARGELYGVVEVGSRQPEAYSPTDAAVLQQFVGQLAVALENAEVYQQSQRVAESKVRSNEIASKLQQQTDVRQILNVTINELGKALNARRARAQLSAEALRQGQDRTGGKSNGNGASGGRLT